LSISRGLAALIIFFTTTLSANYLYKDEVVFLDSVTNEINTIGKELHVKTGINLYSIILKNTPNDINITEYEKNILQEVEKPAVLLILSQSDKEVDISTSSKELLDLFDKPQILSPTLNTGTILPILRDKSESESEAQNVARAIKSAYIDLASQMAKSKNITLESTPELVDYLYKDEVIFLEYVNTEVNAIGRELYQKSGISLYVAVLKELPEGMSIVDYEKEQIKELPKPAILLVISEFDKQIDIMARPQELYGLFDKKQILSPMPNSGTILPILTMKAKRTPLSQKFGAAIQNGYTDLAEQIATSKKIALETIPGNANKEVFMVLRVLFYGMILYALYLYLKRKYILRKKKNEGH
jgi:hypothetical protein